MIAGWCAAFGGILLGACAAPEPNGYVRSQHDRQVLTEQGLQTRMQREIWFAREETARLRQVAERDAQATDAARLSADAKAAELAEALRVLRAIEEDMVAARQRHEATAAERKALEEAEARIAGLEERLGGLRAQAQELTQQVAAAEAELDARRQAAAERAAEVAPKLAALAAAVEALDAALAGLAPPAAPKPDAPPAADAGKK